MLSKLGILACLLGAAVGYPNGSRGNTSTLATNAKTSLTLLYQNNLNASDDGNHVGAILLDPMSKEQATDGCAAVGESLLSRSTLQEHQDDFVNTLSYLEYSGRSVPNQRYWIKEGAVSVEEGVSHLMFSESSPNAAELPVLCAQSSNENSTTGGATTSNEIQITSSGNTYIGYRNQKSFRFLGIPYADPPERFTYPKLYSKKSQTIQTTSYGSQCAQVGSGSEDCLFLNIMTPYIPKANSKETLKPVLFWIHGGGFTSGSGADPETDGGNLASREDIVVVTINYRLSTLGFLAIPGTGIKGNYGIADQITALQWTINNIAEFGGDPNQITIIGESAGAGSVRVLLGSPPALGKFQGAIAMSNLGGGVDLGLTGDYATTYSSYLTIAESYTAAGEQIFSGAGCNQTDLPAQIECLKQVPALSLVGLSTVARYVVQDGNYVNTEELDLVNRNGSTAHVPVIFGNCANDGASFSTYPQTPISSEVEGIATSLDISTSYAQSIIDSGLFPYYDTGNITLDSFNVSQRIATDNQFRCIDQATVYAGMKSGVFPSSSTYYYQMERTFGGYDPNNLGGPPSTPEYPYGDPNLPYFRLHGSDLPWVFGTLTTLRDADDLYSMQLTSGYFAEFVKSGQPNPKEDYLKVRGYVNTLNAVRETGPWNPVEGSEGPIRLMDYPSRQAGFQDLEQCRFLKYPITYYLDGGK
ncbi:hypothetical protein DTO164E3_2537 [Paecilomyces variotii]|nr:hypothetical protein DTO164E3_2537 [Paecilomyces variotii]